MLLGFSMRSCMQHNYFRSCRDEGYSLLLVSNEVDLNIHVIMRAVTPDLQSDWFHKQPQDL